MKMHFLSHYWRKKLIGDIKRQKVLFSALFFLCIFGVGSYIALTMGYTNIYSSLDKIYSETNFADVEITTKPDIWFNVSTLTNFVSEFTDNNPTIGNTSFRLLSNIGHNVSLTTKKETRFQLTAGRAIGIDWNTPVTEITNGLIFAQGEPPSQPEMNGSILLEAHFADVYELQVDDFISTKIGGNNYNFSIKGIVYSPESLIVIPSRHEFLPNNRFGIIYLPLNTLQEYTNLTGLANNIVIKTDLEQTEQTRNLVISKFFNELNSFTNNSFSLPVFQAQQISNWAINMDMEEIQKIAAILPILILGVASISLFITLNRQVQSQRRVIGIASSLGYSPSDILLHYLTFSFLIGCIGGLIGLFGGILLSGGITWVYAYFMGFPSIIIIEVSFPIIFTGYFIGILVTTISGLLPALKANRLTPREAFQGNIVTERGGYTVVEKMFRLTGFRIIFTIPIRNLFRQKFRSFATISAISAAVMILVVSGSFYDSINAGIAQQFTETSQYHLTVSFDGFKFTDLGLQEDISFIEQQPGVLSVDPVLEIPSIVETDGKTQEILLIAWNTSVPQAHNFQWTSKSDELLPNGSLVFTSGLKKTLGLSSGDSIIFGYPNIPEVNLAFFAANLTYNINSGGEYGRNKTIQYLESLITQNKESFSFSTSAQEIQFKSEIIPISGVSEEIWGSIAYTTVQTLTQFMGIDIFKNSDFNIDISPFSKLILKVEQPNNVTYLEELKTKISGLDNIRSISFGYDIQSSVQLTMTTFNVIVGIFIIFACILAGVAIFTAIYVNFQERSKEIATMLTLGLSDFEFFSIITLENLSLTLMGIMGGILPGLLLADWILGNVLRVFYFRITVNALTWFLLWSSIVIVVLLSEIPAILRGLNSDLSEVTKEIGY
ncbi:MAG: ABC transporter permease [Candidatus Hodarchaeales archaeon]|jgi:putative ABC transport system permease protein